MPAGRKKVAVSKLFNDVSNSEAKVPRVQCKFCQTSVAKNGTRMKTLVEKCFLCLKSIKDKYLSVNSNENDSDEENQTVHRLPDFSRNSVKPIQKKQKESGAQITLKNFADKMSKQEQVHLNALLARAIYASMHLLA